MEKIKLFVKKGIRLKQWQAFALIPVLSLLLTFAMLYLQPCGISELIKCMKESNFLMLLLNFLPVFLVMLCLFFLTGNMTAAAGISGFVFILMGIVNRYKMLLRNDPFLPWDLTLGGELMGVIKSFGMGMIIAAAALILFYIAAAAFGVYFLKNNRLHRYLRVGGSIACLGAMLLLNTTLYRNGSLNQDLYVIGNIYNQVNTFNSKGFLYSFIYTYNTNRIAKPADYDSTAVQGIIQNFEQNTSSLADDRKPHIIMIMGEAFSEMSLNPAFDFEGYVDPLENFKEIKKDAIYGEIVTPNLGGGTADTEFDVLTGLSTRHLRGAPFAFRLIGDEFEALPWVLKDIGYRSVALHPGYAWFYNRQNVFPFFGFEDTVFVDAFSEEQNKGMYINEVVTIDKVIQQFEDNLRDNPGTPLFDFCVTIQNHGPYKDKYRLEEANFNSAIPLADDDINAISNYFEGVIDADRELARLLQYFSETAEPVVVVYFGDHLPAFTQDVYNVFYPDIYDENSLDSLSRLYKTPFIIWQNQAAKETTSIEENFKNIPMPGDMVISANYLGAYVLELLGYNQISPFFDYVNTLRKDFPVIYESQSFTNDKVSSNELSEAEKAGVILYRNWEFYKIFDEKYH